MNNDEIKQRLETLKRELQERIDKIEYDLHHKQSSAKFSEQVVEHQNDDVLQGLKAEALEEKAQIDKALLKLDKGLYGQCEKCHQPINPERLEALPFAEFCQRCA